MSCGVGQRVGSVGLGVYTGWVGQGRVGAHGARGVTHTYTGQLVGMPLDRHVALLAGECASGAEA